MSGIKLKKLIKANQRVNIGAITKVLEKKSVFSVKPKEEGLKR